jgi:hypothetical protein
MQHCRILRYGVLAPRIAVRFVHSTWKWGVMIMLRHAGMSILTKQSTPALRNQGKDTKGGKEGKRTM